MRITKADRLDIAAPASVVWQINGTDFADIQSWASSVTASRPTEGEPLPGAPAAGRRCDVAGFGQVVEHLEKFDDANMALQLAVTKGLPFFVKRSEFKSRVHSTGPDTSRFEVHQTMDIAAFPGLFLYPFMARKLAAAVASIMQDLRGAAELSYTQGKPVTETN